MRTAERDADSNSLREQITEVIGEIPAYVRLDLHQDRFDSVADYLERVAFAVRSTGRCLGVDAFRS